MLKTFEDLHKQVSKQVWKSVNTDNFVFRMHYRLTFWCLMTATILVSSRQYIGEHIRCISDTVASNVINTFCFFTTTFTIPRYNNDTQVPHPGVGPMGRAELGDEAVVHHAYYQWVPFVLFGQALMFYLPHLVWRSIEGGTIRVLVKGLEHGYVAAVAEHKVGRVPSKAAFRKQVSVVGTTFVSRLRLNQWWGHWLMGCELLNAINLLLQLVITDSFLGGRFFGLGPAVAAHRAPDTDPLDLIFPKVTKCVFTKYGPTGTIQTHDALCIMALNVINEKIYTFLWFWFGILGVFTALGLLWRVFTLTLHARSTAFNRLLFDVDGRMDPEDFETVISRCEFSHWLFLYYLCKNMHMNATNQLFKDLAAEMRALKSNGYHYRANQALPWSAARGPKAPPSPLVLDEPDGPDGPPYVAGEAAAPLIGLLTAPSGPGVHEEAPRLHND